MTINTNIEQHLQQIEQALTKINGYPAVQKGLGNQWIIAIHNEVEKVRQELSTQADSTKPELIVEKQIELMQTAINWSVFDIDSLPTRMGLAHILLSAFIQAELDAKTCEQEKS